MPFPPAGGKPRIVDMIFKFCPVCGAEMESFEEDGFEREKCVGCGWLNYHNPRPTVSAIIYRNGKILLCHRAASPFKGKWDLPGGFLEEGESAMEGMRREMKEELGIELKDIRLLTVEGPAYYPFGGQDNYNIDVYYEVTTRDEPRVASNNEMTEIGWFDPNNLPPMAFETNVKAIEVWGKLLKTLSDRQ